MRWREWPLPWCQSWIGIRIETCRIALHHYLSELSVVLSVHVAELAHTTLAFHLPVASASPESSLAQVYHFGIEISLQHLGHACPSMNSRPAYWDNEVWLSIHEANPRQW